MRRPGSRARSSIPRAASSVLERHVHPPCANITSCMKVPRKIPRLFREPPRTLFDDPHYEAFEAPVKGPLFSNSVFCALLVVFGIFLMLTADWFGLLLLNSQRFSLRLSVERVAAVAKVARGVPRGDRRDRTADGLQKRHARSGLGLPKERLELAEGLLDGREVRRVWWQVNQRAASRLHEGPDPLVPVGAEVVHNDHLARTQRRREHPLDVGLEDRLGRGTHHRHARPHPLGPHARQERRVLAAVPWNLAVGSLAPGRPGPKPRHGRVSPAFVHEHQAPGIQTPYPFVPARPFSFVALGGREGLFLSGSPKRPKARLRLETETARPCSSSKSSRCSSSVRSGLRETWAGRT